MSLETQLTSIVAAIRDKINSNTTAIGTKLPSASYTAADVKAKVVSTSSGGSTTYLRADGTWATPPGGGSGTSWAPVTATGTGASQNITLPESGLTAGDVMVFVEGVFQSSAHYTITGSTLTTAQPSGMGIVIIRYGVGAQGPAGAAGASGTWGGITGTLSSQTDLQTALNAKQPLSTTLTNTTASYTTALDAKLSGIATGATANSADATLLARANHTGSQTASTISDFAEAVDDRVATLIAGGNGITATYDDAGNLLTLTAKVRMTSGLSGIQSTATVIIPCGIAPRAFTITQGNCYGQSLAAATASTVFTLKKQTTGGTISTVGTFTWGAAGKIATVSITSGSIAANDHVFFEGPATADATLSTPAFLVSE